MQGGPLKYPHLENMYELLIFQGFSNLVFYWGFQDGIAGIVNSRDGLQALMKSNRVQNIYGVSEGTIFMVSYHRSEGIQLDILLGTHH
jgi:hypothetical protein